MLFGASRFYHSSQWQTASSYLRTNHHRQCRIFGASTTLIGPPKFTHFCHHIAICLMPCILEHKSIRIHRVRTLSPYTRVPMCRAERKDTPLWMKRKLRSHGRRWSVRHTYGFLWTAILFNIIRKTEVDGAQNNWYSSTDVFKNFQSAFHFISHWW